MGKSACMTMTGRIGTPSVIDHSPAQFPRLTMRRTADSPLQYVRLALCSRPVAVVCALVLYMYRTGPGDVIL